MGDMTKFNSAIEYYTFNVLLICLLISEIFIFFYTRSKQNRTEKIDTRDLGTKWLLYLNFVFCLIISFLCVSQKAPFYTEISLLRKKMPVLPSVYAENRKESYGIKSYSFFMYKQSKRTPFVV